MEITISRDEYKILLGTNVKLNLIYEIALADDRSYGYSSNTSEMIDAILGIKREEK